MVFNRQTGLFCAPWEEHAFAPCNKAQLESTVSFLSALTSSEKIPSGLKNDAIHCLRILTADSCAVPDLVDTLHHLDGLKTADESMSLGHVWCDLNQSLRMNAWKYTLCHSVAFCFPVAIINRYTVYKFLFLLSLLCIDMSYANSPFLIATQLIFHCVIFVHYLFTPHDS